MKKVLLLGLVIMITIPTLMLQGCDREAQNSNASTPIGDTITTPAPTLVTPVTTVGWGALSTEQREEIVQIGKSHPFGGTVNLNPKIDEIVSVLFIEDIPSNCQKQTLLEYKYSNGAQVGINKILIKGHLENVQKVGSIPDLLNNGACCFEYGGCIKSYECNEPLPEPQKCTPCENTVKPEQECQPCQQQNGYTPGRRQGSGATQEVPADGGNRRIINL